MLANEVICNHQPRQSARRLHLPSDFSKRRSSIIREARNTKASTQGHAEEQLAWLVQQQQQQLTLKEGVSSNSKEIATWEGRAGMRDETKNATEVEMTTENSERTASKVDVGTRLSEQEVVTDALLKKEASTIGAKR